jgi:hypothetical protein
MPNEHDHLFSCLDGFLFFCSSSDQSLFKGKRLRKRLPFVVYPHILEYRGTGKLVARHSENA